MRAVLKNRLRIILQYSCIHSRPSIAHPGIIGPLSYYNYYNNNNIIVARGINREIIG